LGIQRLSFRILIPSIRVIVTTLGFILSLSAGAPQIVGPQTEGTGKASPLHSIGTRLNGKGIPNFARVTHNLYRGAQPSAEGLAALKDLGVEVVVDLRGSASDSERALVNKLGMQYVSIPSHCPFPKDKPWADFLKVMSENRNKKVFVHCRLGDDRTGLAIASYRIADEGWSADEALNEMKAFGFRGVHHVMCPGLAEYVEHLPDRLKNSPAFRESVSQSNAKSSD
jgi:tyrosine-protein phosphatase SIW14